MNRRNFIKNTSAAVGVTILNFPVFGKNAPSNKVVLAVMGVNSRGNYLAKSFASLENVEVAYICDVEDGAIKNGLEALKDAPRKALQNLHKQLLLQKKKSSKHFHYNFVFFYVIFSLVLKFDCFYVF